MVYNDKTNNFLLNVNGQGVGIYPNGDIEVY